MGERDNSTKYTKYVDKLIFFMYITFFSSTKCQKNQVMTIHDLLQCSARQEQYIVVCAGVMGDKIYDI